MRFLIFIAVVIASTQAFYIVPNPCFGSSVSHSAHVSKTIQPTVIKSCVVPVAPVCAPVHIHHTQSSKSSSCHSSSYHGHSHFSHSIHRTPVPWQMLLSKIREKIESLTLTFGFAKIGKPIATYKKLNRPDRFGHMMCDLRTESHSGVPTTHVIAVHHPVVQKVVHAHASSASVLC